MLNSTSKCNFEGQRELSCYDKYLSIAKSKEHSYEHIHSFPTHKRY